MSRSVSVWSDPTVLVRRQPRVTEYEFTKHPDPTTFVPTCPECCGALDVVWRMSIDGGRDALVCSMCRLEV